MPRKKSAKVPVPVSGRVRVRSYEVFRRALDDGIESGWRWAHKHTDAPDPESIKDAVADAILNEVCELFDFDG